MASKPQRPLTVMLIEEYRESVDSQRTVFEFKNIGDKPHGHWDYKICLTESEFPDAVAPSLEMRSRAIGMAQDTYDKWLQLREMGSPLARAAGPVLDVTLKERGNTHGRWRDQASRTFAIKSVMHTAEQWNSLTPGQQEALDMIAVKIGRILEGDPSFKDHWHDIGGYAKLEEDCCPE